MRRWRVPRLPVPKGLELDEDEVLSACETVVEWVAYLYETQYDSLLTIAALATLYDCLWTPCLFLLPIETGVASLFVGIAIDAALLMSIGASAWVWGLQGNIFRTTLDVLVALPWELLGLATEAQRPVMWARCVAKVRPDLPRWRRRAIFSARASASGCCKDAWRVACGVTARRSSA